MHQLARLVTITPVVCSSDSILADKEVFWIVDVLVWSGSNAIKDTGFEVYENRTGDVPCVVRLVEEDILPVTTLSREIL